MLLRLCALLLLLFSAGCAAPQAGAAEDAAAGTLRPGTGIVKQQAMLPGDPSARTVTPSGLTALPDPSTDLNLPQPPQPRPSIVRVSRPLQCVPYARDLSKIALRGNAWTWWTKAKGQYRRGARPEPGAVMVFSKTRRLRFGHLAVVAEVKSSREILVHQANWLNGGRIHRYTPVIDVSENNDWSEVRVWYTPGHQYGTRHYPVYGFIYPTPDSSPEIRQASN